jgi:hypothetical protein
MFHARCAGSRLASYSLRHKGACGREKKSEAVSWQDTMIKSLSIRAASHI